MAVTSSLNHIADIVNRWYVSHGRHELPWRQKGVTAYEIWVSEIMLQQTQVSRVIPFYLRFLHRFPTVQQLASADWDDFLPYYQGLGYYRRGRNMLLAAQMVCEKFGGRFPSSPEELELLPGIGPYTARAIASFAFHLPVLSFDTNHQRVWGRLLFGNKKAIVPQADMERQLQTADLFTLNAALMDFANDVCKQKPLCATCPLQSQCRFFATQGKLEPISTKKRSTFPHKSAQVILTLHENHQKYYSSRPDVYEPFSLSNEHNTRESIKKFFLEKHDLVLAVRPPHKKSLVNGKPTLFVNAQILQGTPPFRVYRKEER